MLVARADASHGYSTDGGSQLGYLIFFVGENNKSSIFSL